MIHSYFQMLGTEKNGLGWIGCVSTPRPRNAKAQFAHWLLLVCVGFSICLEGKILLFVDFVICFFCSSNSVMNSVS